jgi:peptidoglycan hydrolase CwlO-like protein
MMWISIALIVIVTEAILYDLYKERFRKQEPEKENESLDSIEQRLKALEDQVSSIRVAQGMRRRDG